MVKCPWGCGWEGEPKDYSEHLLTCPKAKEKAAKHPTLSELFKGTVLNGYLEAARVKPLTEFAEGIPKQLKFTERVLGHKATTNLRQKKVIQTIRSDKEIEHLKERDLIEITLDDKYVGKANITSIDKIRLSELAHDDAIKGGFSNLADLQGALVRAGFRYKPLSEYVENRVLLTWEKELLVWKITGEESGKLADFFLEKLRKAGVPLPSQYKDDFEKALDPTKTYEEHLVILEKVVDDIIKKVMGKEPEKSEEVWKEPTLKMWRQPILEYVVEKTVKEGWAKEEDIYKEFKDRGATEEEIKLVLRAFIIEGTFYSPRPGFLRKT